MLRYESAYRLHVAPAFTHRPVGAIKPSHIQAWIKDLSKRLGPSTVITTVLVLQGILDLAVADDAIKKNPVKSPVVHIPGHQASDIAVWEDQIVAAVIEAHPDELRTIPELAVS
jgi:Phage integrase, N-terminal SAM-like domain